MRTERKMVLVNQLFQNQKPDKNQKDWKNQIMVPIIFFPHILFWKKTCHIVNLC